MAAAWPASADSLALSGHNVKRQVSFRTQEDRTNICPAASSDIKEDTSLLIFRLFCHVIYWRGLHLRRIRLSFRCKKCKIYS
eukprot:scaffold408941_cov17-Prasinocladus_malaysianus.AAC.1